MATLALGFAAAAGLLLTPIGAVAETAAPSASPAASPAPAPSPSSPKPASTPATPAPTPAASAKHQALQNRESQGQLIAVLTASEAHALMLEKSLNQSELSLIALGQQILESQKEISQLDARIAQVSAQREETSRRLKTDRAELAGVIRRLYKHQDNFLARLIDAGGFGGLLESIGYSDVIVDREKNLIRAVQADDVALAHAEATLQRSRDKKQEAQTNLETARRLLAREIASEQALQTQLQATIDEGLAALDAMQSDSPEMAAKRAKLVKMRTESVLTQIEQAVFAQQSFQSAAQLVEDPILGAGGRLLWPIPHATITQGFGPSRYTFEAAYAGFPHFHTGIDLSVPLGTPVFAAADGVVGLARPMTDAAGNLVGYGNYIVIQHEAGLKTLYGHLLTIGVREGDTVKRGQLIGLVGSTGNSTGPHTHFEVRVENSPIDPIQLLAEAGVSSQSPAP